MSIMVKTTCVGSEGIQERSVHSSQFCCKSRTALMKSFLKMGVGRNHADRKDPVRRKTLKMWKKKKTWIVLERTMGTMIQRIQLNLERHGFELHGSTYTWIFQYNTSLNYGGSTYVDLKFFKSMYKWTHALQTHIFKGQLYMEGFALDMRQNCEERRIKWWNGCRRIYRLDGSRLRVLA